MKKEFEDQLGRKIFLDRVPQRIISTVPSQTELLYDLGLGEKVIGITKFCVHPKVWFHSKTRIGGTKTLNLPLIESLSPDLIIANKEENTKEEIDLLCSRFNVWISDVTTLSSANEMISSVGEMMDQKEKADEIIYKINQGFERLDVVKPQKPKTALYFIWQNPYLSVGNDTFIHDMMTKCGLVNLLEDHIRYPELSMVQMIEMNPDVIILSSEPFPFKEKHALAFQEKLPHSKILLADGEMFSWYGSRLIKAADYFQAFIQQII